MSNETKNRIDTLTSEGSTTKPADTDWEAKYKELEKQLNSTRVEEGRVKKLSEDLKAANDELEKLRAKREDDDIISGLTEDERSSIPDEVLQATAKMVRKAKDDSERRYREYEARRNDEVSAGRKERLERFIDERFPRFWRDVGPGGDKESAWNDYKLYNRSSIAEAMNEGNTSSIEYHIRRFYNDHCGIPVPSVGQDGSAAPDPENRGGGQYVSSVNGKKYTQEEINDLYDKEATAHQRYLDTMSEYDKKSWMSIKQEIAAAEGRTR